ncbi:MAG: hypothetical protein FE048_02495 [Thermoplasmata archaeon]|nr:MAG: hypothetical protein FE048_02495 [Thermoplasmata archaeon]
MKTLQLVMIILNIPPILLAFIAFLYFQKLMKLIKVKRGAILALSGVFLFLGYFFFILPWLLIGSEVDIMKEISYSFITIAFLILLYGITRIYMDWKEVIK